MTDSSGLAFDDAPSAVPPDISWRSRGVALAVGIPLGIFGAHRFYAGRTRSAWLQLCTLGGFALWWLYDMILLVAGEFTDAQGRRIRRWAPDADTPGGSAGEAARLAGEVERLQGQVAELAERVDFAERLLARGRDRLQ